QGHARALTILGYCYNEGMGVKQDKGEAIKLFRVAASKEYPEAQYLLGLAYVHGTGVSRDFVEASKWFSRAAEWGEPRAQFNIGVSYATGQGVGQGPVQARCWFTLAAAQGQSHASDAVRQLERSMRPEQVSAARRLAEAWRPKERVYDENMPDWE